jgi:ribosomal protein L7Ae-like RNA K-turn-binding protein
MSLFCDDKATINIVHNPVQHDWMKHIEVDKHFIKKKLNEKTICILFVKTKEQLPNVFTKGLIRKMCMRDIYVKTKEQLPNVFTKGFIRKMCMRDIYASS